MRASGGRERAISAAVIAVIVAAVLVVHAPALPTTWDADDGLLLEYALRYSPWQYFFVPAYTHGLSPANVTPWLAFAYDADLYLFGLSPAAFYRVQLAAIAAIAVLAYLVMRLWLTRLDAAAAALLFVVGATTRFAATHLMIAHYVDGLAFTLCAVLAYVHAVRSRSPVALGVSAAAYALALTCKELYVPLPLVLLLLPESDWRTRLRHCVPHFALLGLYALWRRAVLGSFVGGYASGGGLRSDDLANTVTTFTHLPNALLGNGAPMLAASIALLVVAALALYRRRVNAALALVVLAVVLLPLVPLGVLGAIETPDRFFFLLWLVVACALAWGASVAIDSAPLRVVVHAVVGAAAFQNLAAAMPSDMSTLYAFVQGGGSDRALVIDKGQPYLNNQLNGLVFAYRTLQPQRAMARVVGRDELPDAPIAAGATTSWYEWSPPCRCVAPTTPEAQRAGVQEQSPGAGRPQPSVDIAWDAHDRTMRWKAGPYSDGTWTIRYESAPQLWTVKYDSWRRTGGANVFWPDASRPFRFFVRFESAQGWAVRTPVLSFTPGIEPNLSWSPPS